MHALAAVLLSAVVWKGTAQVYVMNWEGGGEHPYRTDFELTYREAAPTEIRDSSGKLIGRRIRLVPERIALRARHEVRGLLNCVGAGEETIAAELEAAIVVPLQEESLLQTLGFAVPAAGAYELVLPRAYAAYACGQNQRNKGDRRTGIGTGLFFADVEFGDREARFLEAGGSRMRGSYEFRRARSAGGSLQHLVKKEIHVKWDLHREGEP